MPNGTETALESLNRETNVTNNSQKPVHDQEAGIAPAIFQQAVEQADLASQMENWELVGRLGDEGFRLTDYPNDPLERFVFIEGYAHLNNWERMKELAFQSYKVSPNYVGPLLCKLLNRINLQTPASNIKDIPSAFACLNISSH